MSEKTIIEINGVKLEVDLSSAKRIDEFKVGDAIKVLIKNYGDSFKSYPGMIIGFDHFENRPSLIIAYVEQDYSSVSIKTMCFNKDSKDVEIAHTNETELKLTRQDFVELTKDKINKLNFEISNLQNQIEVFHKTFSRTYKVE